MLKIKVEALLKGALETNKSLFLIDFSVTAENVIKVVLDGDSGVTVEDCMMVSRAIEHNLDREDEDFSLEVASVGATAPLGLPRQFKKNVGRKIQVDTHDESFEAKLTGTTENGIVVEWKVREPKPIGKGKITVQKKREINFSEIKVAKVVLKF